jgi:hypothetical protein
MHATARSARQHNTLHCFSSFRLPSAPDCDWRSFDRGTSDIRPIGRAQFTANSIGTNPPKQDPMNPAPPVTMIFMKTLGYIQFS